MTLFTKLLGRKVRLLGVVPHEQYIGRTGKIVNVYLWPGPPPSYTVMLKDGRLLDEVQGADFVVEE